MPTLIRLDKYPEHLKFIGMVVTNFTSLEVSLSVLMWELIGCPDRGSALFYSVRLNHERLEMLKALTAHLPDGTIKHEVESVLSAATGMATERNRIAHAQWAVEEEGATNLIRIDRKAGKDLRTSADESTMTPTRVGDLQRIAMQIAEVDERVMFIAEVMRAKREPQFNEGILNIRRQFPGTDAKWRPYD